MEAPGDEPDSGLGTGGIQSSGGRGGSAPTGSGGGAGSPVGSGGRGGTAGTPGTGGAAGAGGKTTGTGGTTPGTGGTTPGTGGTTPGTGGTAGAAGKGGAGGTTTGTGGTTPGTGGTTPATGGTTGTGGMATGGTTATGGAAGGKGGAAGSPATGGTTGTGGSAGKGGAAGGAGGAAGSGAYSCPLGGTLDCSTAGAVKLPGGLVTDFSAPQWNATTSQFCDADGLRGRLFSFVGTAAGDASAVTVDATAQNLKLAVTAKDYVGGGLIFESCTNVSGYTSVQFTATLASGSLSGCTWQVQLQTQEQRRAADTDPTGGTCTSTTCYAYPLVANLPVPGVAATLYTELFSAFTPASSTAATPTQVVGIQWQVGSSSSAGCTAELRIDNIKFQ